MTNHEVYINLMTKPSAICNFVFSNNFIVLIIEYLLPNNDLYLDNIIITTKRKIN